MQRLCQTTAQNIANSYILTFFAPKLPIKPMRIENIKAMLTGKRQKDPIQFNPNRRQPQNTELIQ